MKKSVIVFGLVALFGLGLVSCKKDCTCVGKVNGVTVVSETTKTKKKDCQASYKQDYGYGTVTVNCTWGK